MSLKNTNRRHAAHAGLGGPRRGAALIVAMICLLLATMLAGSLVRGALLQREQVLRDERQVQAAWLADAALERARLRLQSSPEFGGEMWRPRISEDAPALGVVAIVVERATEED